MAVASSLPTTYVLLAFNLRNQLAVRSTPEGYDLPFYGSTPDASLHQLRQVAPAATAPSNHFSSASESGSIQYSLVQVQEPSASLQFESLDVLEASPCLPRLSAALQALAPHLIEVPYLHLGENDFIYKFRPDKERNRQIYQIDAAAATLYQSKLCTAIKALARTHERTAAAPVTLDFGCVHYVIPSHFGFCLGVKNAIERAYETLAENPGRRVFMLSELIHNPFVNEDLLRRGLRYLQSEKGKPYTTEGKPATGQPGETTWWDTLTPEDIVIIPAFGATDEDKQRLVRKGVPVYPYDATCMLVEKVWKAARAFGREGYTIVIHGKHEHEETKATFSNARRHAPALIIRNLSEAQSLGRLVLETDPHTAQADFERIFAGKFTAGFSVERDLQRLAVVNQTTLLMNETLEIIQHLRQVFRARFGDAEVEKRVGGGAKRDTLCYATQVNQDALARALATPLDAALVIGGKNSSNTFQLYRLCEEKLGASAYFVQSEANLLDDGIEHFVFPHAGSGPSGHYELRPLAWPNRPARILLTGGASCPDGIIQQVIHRLNRTFPPAQLRSIDAVLADLEAAQE